MVTVDSSALIPLAWVGRLDLVAATFDEVRTTRDVYDEVLTDGKRGTATLEEFLEDCPIHEPSPRSESVASLTGISTTDASVILLADDEDDVLLANDKALIEVAQSHDIECWWVTTLLLRCAKAGTVTADEANGILYDLVDEGMNLHPKIYAAVQRKIDELGS